MSKKIFILLLFLIIFFVGLTNSVQSVDEDNAFLKIMRINKEGIEPDFEKEITEYYIVIDENIENLEITAISENPEATVEILGNNNLVNGINNIKIIVKSKNGTNVKTYNINVTKTSNLEKANANLENLAIENTILFPEFQTRITEYKAEIANDVNKINILAIPEKQESKISIEGTETLKEGMNEIIIKVLAENKITEKKYVIKVYKRNEQEEIAELARKEENKQKIMQIAEKNQEENNIKKVNSEIEIQAEKKETKILVIAISVMIIILIIINNRNKKAMENSKK